MVIQLHNLAKTFRVGLRNRRVEAVRCVNLNVQEGEILGLIGPNGAGKSTTLHMLLGLVKPTGGGGQVLGQPLGSRESRRHIGYLPELPHFSPHLKTRELLQLAGRLSGMSAADIRSRSTGLLAQVGLEGKENAFLGTFSKGMLQRAGLAQALIAQPRLLILDEPMSGLDPPGRHIVREVIASLRQQGVTVLFSSHIMPDVEALCDRVCMMNQGRSLLTQSVRSLLDGQTYAHEIVLRPHGETSTFDNKNWQTRSAGDGLVRVQLDATEDLQQAIDQLRDLGSLLQISPLRRSLDDVLVEVLQREEPPIEGAEP